MATPNINHIARLTSGCSKIMDPARLHDYGAVHVPLCLCAYSFSAGLAYAVRTKKKHQGCASQK